MAKNDEAPAEETTPIGDEVESEQAQEQAEERGQEAADASGDEGPEAPQGGGPDTEEGVSHSPVNAGTAPESPVENDGSQVLEPGDEGYDPFSDPVVPNSQIAQIVAEELKSGESPTRDALVEAR